MISFSCADCRPAAVLHETGDPGFIPCAAEQPEFELISGQAFVYDVNSNEFIYLKGSAFVIYPASTTKLLTILYALELLDPAQIVSPGSELELVGTESSIAYIKRHHSLSVEMLIEGMMLPSGNDAAYVLAAAGGKVIAGNNQNNGNAGVDGREAVRLFVAGMNDYAAKIGLCGSNFASPDGYFNDNHYSTIEDITLISKLASQNEIIMRYAGMASDNVTYASGHTNTWYNTNQMLNRSSKYFCEYVTGLKTGSAGAGNYSLITTLNFGDGMGQYIIGIFSSPNRDDRYRDTQIIIDYLINEKK